MSVLSFKIEIKIYQIIFIETRHNESLENNQKFVPVSEMIKNVRIVNERSW